MKIKGRKVLAYTMTWATLFICGVLTILFATDQWALMAKWWLISLVVNSLTFISFNVVKDYIRSKHFKSQIWETDHKIQDEGNINDDEFEK